MTKGISGHPPWSAACSTVVNPPSGSWHEGTHKCYKKEIQDTLRILTAKVVVLFQAGSSNARRNDR